MSYVAAKRCKTGLCYGVNRSRWDRDEKFACNGIEKGMVCRSPDYSLSVYHVVHAIVTNAPKHSQHIRILSVASAAFVPQFTDFRGFIISASLVSAPPNLGQGWS